MTPVKKKIRYLAKKFNLQLIYAFGSRAKEISEFIEEKKKSLRVSKSDLDIGIKPSKPLTIKEKTEIALFLEELFHLPVVDVIVIPEAPSSLAVEIIKGELLYAEDDTYEAEYQLYILKRFAELLPYEREKKRFALEIER
jgi:uncharacterized protein